LTDSRLAETTDASRYATRRARRAAERQRELAALAASSQDPSPISQPVPVVEAPVAAPGPQTPVPRQVDAGETFAELFGFGVAETAASSLGSDVAAEPSVVDVTEPSSVDIGELVAELADAEPAAEAARVSSGRRSRERKHRAAAPATVGSERERRETRAMRAARPARLKPAAVPRPAVPRPAVPRPAVLAPRRSPGRMVLSGCAMLSAAGLAVAMALPGATFGAPAAAASSSETAAASVAAATDGMLSGQSVTVADGSLAAAGTDATGGRGDNFSAQSSAETIRAQYAGHLFHPTFVPTAGAIRWPFPYSVAVSAPYGYSSGYGFGWHDGVDFIPGYGAPVSAIASGVVIWVGNDGALGYCVRIQHSVGGHTVVSIYGHMISGSSGLYPGESIEVGQQVGLTGQTGQATGPHLHLGLQVDGEFTDPYVWLTQNATNAD